jgi:hypothetical protein
VLSFAVAIGPLHKNENGVRKNNSTVLVYTRRSRRKTAATCEPKTPRYMCTSSTTTNLYEGGAVISRGHLLSPVGIPYSTLYNTEPQEWQRRPRLGGLQVCQQAGELFVAGQDGDVQHVGVGENDLRAGHDSPPLGVRRVPVHRRHLVSAVGSIRAASGMPIDSDSRRE